MSHTNKIGLFGGTFDPIHMGHLIVAESVLNELNLDKICFIPAHKHALKLNQNISPPEVRLEILKIALSDFSYFMVSDIEIKSNNVSFTIDTLRKIKEYENFLNPVFYFIIGSDILTELHLWKEYEKIMDMVHLVVLKRPGGYNQQLIDKYKKNIIIPKSPQIDISSTVIRQRIRENKPWKSMVTPEVHDYIIHHKLYK